MSENIREGWGSTTETSSVINLIVNTMRTCIMLHILLSTKIYSPECIKLMKCLLYGGYFEIPNSCFHKKTMLSALNGLLDHKNI